MIAIGAVAPDFTLPTHGGETVSLSEFRGRKVVVLYFYPKDNTPGCTVESCAFRDAYADFVDLGAEVLGVSSDSLESHASFAETHRLPFRLLSDGDGAVRRAWKVPRTLGMLPGRVTFVIDKEGVVRWRFNSQLRVKQHVREALARVRDLV